MHGNTAIADALRRSGYEAQTGLRRQTAYELLRLCDNDLTRAVSELRSAKADMEAESLRGAAKMPMATIPSLPLPRSLKAKGSATARVLPIRSVPPLRLPKATVLALRRLITTLLVPARRPPNSAPEDLPSRDTQCVTAPARQPTQKPRSAADIKAAIEIERSSARTILATMLTSDGIPWGDVGFHELDGMQRDGSIAKAIKHLYGSRYARGDNRLRFKRLKELLTPDEFRQAVDLAKETVNG